MLAFSISLNKLSIGDLKFIKFYRKMTIQLQKKVLLTNKNISATSQGELRDISISKKCVKETKRALMFPT